MKRAPVEIGIVNTENLLPALDAVRGCWKATTILWMRAMGLSVLSGIIVPGWSSQTGSVIRNFCSQNEFSELLLRIDKSGQRWTRRRGGYILPLSMVRETVTQLSKEGMIAILLEPASPCANYYAMGAVTIPSEKRIVIEVVGRGFDASDILRSDLQPHERFVVQSPTDGRRLKALEEYTWKRTYLVDTPTYQKSVEERLAKIGARLESPAFPDAVLNLPKAERKGMIRRATEFLHESGQNLLLKHRMTYIPIPRGYLSRFVGRVCYLLDALASYGIHLGATSISASIISDRRLIFWDFFPANKLDTAALIPKNHSVKEQNPAQTI